MELCNWNKWRYNLKSKVYNIYDFIKINRYTHEIDGSGFLDDIKNKVLEKFTVEIYPGKRHARVGLTGDQGYNFAGPGTNLVRRLERHTGNPKRSSIPINNIDAAALRHDTKYGEIADAYKANPTPENKKTTIKTYSWWRWHINW